MSNLLQFARRPQFSITFANGHIDSFLDKMSNTESKVYIALIADTDNRTCYASVKHLAETSGMSLQAIYSAIAGLEIIGAIAVERSVGDDEVLEKQTEDETPPT